MQINSLLNVLMSTPGSTLGAAAGGNIMTGIDGLAALPGTPTGAAGQFGALLAPGIIPGAVNGTAVDAQVTATDTPTGDITPSPMSNIAIPPLPTYIDQVEKPVVLSEENLIDANSKKRIFENFPALNQTQKVAADASNTAQVASNSALANEVYNHQKAAAKADAKDNGKEGKISLAGLDTGAGDVNQAEFTQAVAKLAENAKQKTTAKTEASAVEGKVVDQKQTDLTTKTAINDKAAESLAAQPHVAATKIAAKILGVKEDKLKTEISEAELQLTTRLQDLDTQLRSRDFSKISHAREALQQSPAEQIQIRINQAVAAGVDSIKIELHPAELGSVDVDMEVDHAGNTKIRIVAERAETLDLLRQSSGELAKSLQQAGVQADASNLQFSLRGEQQQNRDFGSNGNNGQQDQQQQASINGNYSRYSRINEQELMLSIGTKGLNILV